MPNRRADIRNEFEEKEARRKRFLKDIRQMVIAEDDVVLGFGHCIIENKCNSVIGTIDKVYIDKPARNRGVGKAIVRHLMKEYRSKVEYFEWHCYEWNKVSIISKEKLRR